MSTVLPDADGTFGQLASQLTATEIKLPLPRVFQITEKPVRQLRQHGDPLLDGIEQFLDGDGPSCDNFFLKLPDTVSLDDLRKPEEWYTQRHARPVTAADRLRKHHASHGIRDSSAIHLYAAGARTRRRTKASAALGGSMRSEASLPASMTLPGEYSVGMQDSLVDGDSVVLNARSGIFPQGDASLLHGSTALDMHASLASAGRSGPAPTDSGAGGSTMNFATSSLAFTGEGGMQLAGLSGMFGPASMPDLTRHDPREPSSRAGRARARQAAEGGFPGAVSNANRAKAIKSFLPEDATPDLPVPASSSLPLGVAPRDPYMGAGTAAGYGVGHEVRLAERSSLSFGHSLASIKAGGNQVFMFEEDEREAGQGGWDPAEVGKARMSESYLQTGSGLKPFAFKGRRGGTLSKEAINRALTAPLAPISREGGDGTLAASMVAPALTTAGGTATRTAPSATGAAATLAATVKAQLAATPLFGDPRGSNFRPHASITRSGPNRARRRKLAKGAARGKGQPVPQSLSVALGMGPSLAGPPKTKRSGGRGRARGGAASLKPYDAGGARGLGAGLGAGSTKVPYALSDSTTADGSLLTGEAMAEMITAFEGGGEIRRLRAELEAARGSLETSTHLLQTRARDWYAAHNNDVVRMANADLLALSGTPGNIHSREPNH